MKNKQKFKQGNNRTYTLAARIVALVCALLIAASAFVFLFF
jgi:hypothetical protein